MKEGTKRMVERERENKTDSEKNVHTEHFFLLITNAFLLLPQPHREPLDDMHKGRGKQQ